MVLCSEGERLFGEKWAMFEVGVGFVNGIYLENVNFELISYGVGPTFAPLNPNFL